MRGKGTLTATCTASLQSLRMDQEGPRSLRDRRTPPSPGGRNAGTEASWAYWIPTEAPLADPCWDAVPRTEGRILT